MADYINISAFLIGITTAFFTIFALHILFWRKNRTRFQTVLGCVMAVWGVWNAKDIVITFPGMYRKEVLDWILVIDGWSALTYTMLLFEVVMPKWLTLQRLLLLSLPFGIFTLFYFVWPDERVIYAYLAFLWCYAWTVVCIGYIKMKRYLVYVHKNYSNIENIDVAWLRPVFFFAIVSQLAWLLTSLSGTVIADIIYYISIVLLWLMVLHYSWNFQPIVIEKNIESESASSNKNVLPIAEGTLERLMDEQQLYLKKDLTLSDLAVALDSNRTYVSKYISQVLGLTFYDYINQLRIERVSIPMMRLHPEYKLDYVSQESGFASISTFRRAFIKLTGQTPSQFEISEK
jgi:AraC-like DNA-binding protein